MMELTGLDQQVEDLIITFEHDSGGNRDKKTQKHNFRVWIFCLE